MSEDATAASSKMYAPMNCSDKMAEEVMNSSTPTAIVSYPVIISNCSGMARLLLSLLVVLGALSALPNEDADTQEKTDVNKTLTCT